MVSPETQLFDLEIEGGWGLRCCDSIDFAVWVLVREGILIPPIDKHEAKDSALAKLGFDATSWHNWVKRMVLTQESGYYIKFVDIDATITKQISQAQEYIARVYPIHDIPIPDVNWRLIKAKLRQKLEYENRLHERFIEDCAGIDIDNIPSLSTYEPHLYWQGNTAIKEYLTQLWNEYNSIEKSYRLLEQSLCDPKLFFDNFNNPRFKTVCCQMYWLHYPYPVQYAITRESVIIGVPSSEASDKNKIAQYYTEAIELTHNLSITNQT